MPNSLPFEYQDFSGGLNTLDAANLLADNQARDLSNVQGTTAGAIVKRRGLTTLSQPADTLTSLFGLESISPVVLVGAGGTSLYKITTGGTATVIKTGLTSGLRWEFCSAPVMGGQGPLYGMNGTDTPQQWTGTGNTADWTLDGTGAVAVPNGKYCLYANNQVFVSGVSGFPSRVYWSAIANPRNWDPASLLGSGFEDFDPNDGEAISGIGIVGPYILVAKPRKLWILVNPATAQTRRLSESVGVAAHRSISAGPSGTYFLAEDRGVYLTNGSSVTAISDQIQPSLDGIVDRTKASGVCFDAHYYLSVGIGSSTTDTTFDFDEKLSNPRTGSYSWWKHSFGSNQFTVWHPTGPSRLYSAKSTAAYVDRCFVPNEYQDNGSSFTWVWRGPWQSPSFYRRRRFPTTYFRKRLRQMRLDGFGQVDLSLAKDFAPAETLIRSNIFDYVAGGSDTFGGSGTFGGTGTFGGGPTADLARVDSLGVARAFSVVLSSTANSPAVLNAYVLMLTDRRDLVVA